MSGITCGSINDINRFVVDYTKDNKCSNCGGCCTNFLPVSKLEILRIRAFLREHPVKEQKTLYPVPGKVFDMTCPFLSRTKETEKCLIYPVRPLICRRFLCNQPQDLIKEQKQVLIDKNGLTDLRREFARDFIN